MAGILKIVLLIVYLASDYRTVLARLQSLDGIKSLVVFTGLYAALVTGLVAAAFIRRPLIRFVLASLFAVASILQFSFEWTTTGPLTYASFSNLYASASSIDQSVAQHGLVLIQAIVAALLLFAGIAIPPRRFALRTRWAMWVPAMACGVLTTILYLRGGEGSRALPAAYPSISYLGFHVAEELSRYRGPREKPALPRTGPVRSDDLVVLVDESIAGNYLDLNNPAGVRSGLLDPRVGVRVTNFGYASSIGKCSSNSNVALRYGGTQQNFAKAEMHWPSIWAYAKAAGLRTVYIDAQSEHGHMQNMMTAQERAEIDEFIQFDDVPAIDRDMQIAKVLADHINNRLHEFIYVNKLGAHFPIAGKYPEDMTRYRPALPRSKIDFLAWTSNRDTFTGTAQNWVQYRNSYRNTLDWNVGVFFDRLLAKADLRRATIVYTSDHGQDLHERYNPGNNTHCGADNSAQEEGLVPLAIIESSSRKSLDWNTNLAANSNASSDFRIFPTLLALMGFDRAVFTDRYGLPLDQVAHDNFAYGTDFAAPLLGQKPHFRPIDIKTVVSPPASDFVPTK